MTTLYRKSTLTNRKFMEFFFPSVLMAMSSSLSIIVDSIIVGNVLGSSELAAMNLIMPLSLCFTAVTAIFGIGASICIPAFKGKLDHVRADQCLTLSCMAWLVCSVFTVLLGIFATDGIASFLSGSSGLTAYVAEYLRVYLIGSPFTFITMIFPHIIRSDGKPKLASNVLIIANVTNLVLDVVFMKYAGMGLTGGSLATICGYALGSFLYLIYVFSKARTLHMARIRLSDLKLYLDMIKFSISSILGQGFMFAKLWIFNMVISAVAGQEGLTAFSVCTSCLSFVSMFIAGAAQTMMPMVGAFNGSGDHTAVGMTIRKALRMVIGCCIGTTVLFELFPSVVLMLFGVTDGAALELGIVAVRLFSLALTGIGISFLFMYYAQASGMPSFSMQICALEGFFVVVPVALLMAWRFGITGFWLAYTINEVIVISFILLKTRYVVKSSKGERYSVFMLQKPKDNMLEMSVCVADEEEKEYAVAAILAQEGGNGLSEEKAAGYPETLLREIFQISDLAYDRKGTKASGRIMDILVEKDRITCKDLGTGYASLTESGMDFSVTEGAWSCEHTMMIGMNYLELRKREVSE